MEKYGLNPAELKIIKRRWLCSVPKSADPFVETFTGIQRRTVPRREPLYQIPVYDKDNPLNRGIIDDIHVKGLRIIGIIVMTDERKTFAIHTKPYNIYGTLTFEAECRWSMINENGECVAGFRITNISQGNTNELKKLINALTIQA